MRLFQLRGDGQNHSNRHPMSAYTATRSINSSTTTSKGRAVGLGKFSAYGYGYVYGGNNLSRGDDSKHVQVPVYADQLWSSSGRRGNLYAYDANKSPNLARRGRGSKTGHKQNQSIKLPNLDQKVAESKFVKFPAKSPEMRFPGRTRLRSTTYCPLRTFSYVPNDALTHRRRGGRHILETDSSSSAADKTHTDLSASGLPRANGLKNTCQYKVVRPRWLHNKVAFHKC
mmetsp:Transcript_14374/g.25856  ORF Transcript_14374/g.25856 Transcript_14374/m.25856 type:complete len:228 (-) Transcript_14374:168-851(-)